MPYDSRQTLRTVAFGAFWRLLRYPFLFLSLIVIPRYMGRELYGQFAYFVSVLTVCEAFTSLGNLQIFGRFVPDMGGDPAREARLFQGILFYGTALVALFSAGLAAWFLLVQPNAFPLRWLPILICIMLAGKVQGTTFAFLYGRNQIGRFSARELLRSAFTFALVAGLYALTGSLDAALWGLALNEIALLLFAAWWGRDVLFQRWSRLPFREFRPYFLFGVTFYIPTVLLFFLQRAAPIFIRNQTGGFEQVAPFDLANQFLMTTGMFLGLVFTTLVPALSRLEADNRHADIARWNRTALAWCGALALCVYAALAYAGRPVIGLLLGPEFLDTHAVALITGLAFIPMLVSHMGLNYSVVRKKPSAYAAAAVFGVAAMVAGSLLWIPRHGAIGAAWATVAGHTAAAIVYAVAFRAAFLAMLRDFLFVAGLGLLAAVPAVTLRLGPPALAGAGIAAVGVYLALLAGLRILGPREIAAVWRAVRRPSA